MLSETDCINLCSGFALPHLPLHACDDVAYSTFPVCSGEVLSKHLLLGKAPASNTCLHRPARLLLIFCGLYV